MTQQSNARRSDRRATNNFQSVLTAGKVVFDGRDHFCLIRNVSSDGLMVEMPAPPPVGYRVQIEAAGLNPCGATVVWSDNRLIGLEFDAPMDVDLMGRRGVADGGLIVRGPRFRCDRVAELIAEDRACIVEVVNIGVGGAKLRGVSGIALNAVGRLVMGSPMPPLAGSIRWQVREEVGFKFAETLSRETMAVLLR